MKNTILILLLTISPLLVHAQGQLVKGAAKAATAKGVSKAVTGVPAGAGFRVVNGTFINTNLRPLTAATEGEILATVMSNSPTKTLLNRQHTYDLERYTAKAILGKAQQLQPRLDLGDLAAREALLTEIIAVRNDALHDFLSQSIKTQNYEQFLMDLADYYSVPVEFISSTELRFIASKNPAETFAQSAANYMVRHPHKINLKFREIMKNPFLEASLKDLLRGYIAARSLTPVQQHQLLELLKEAYTQHTKSIVQAEHNAQSTVIVYQEMLARLEQFVAQHGRLPAWHSGNPQERLLFNRISVIMEHNQTNFFKDVLPLREKIQTILESYPKKYITLDETTDRLIEYVEKHGTTPSWPEDETTLTYAEGLFLESVFYWWTKDMNFRSLFEKYRYPDVPELNL